MEKKETTIWRDAEFAASLDIALQDWNDRLVAAVRDGLELEGLAAVQDAIRAANRDLKLGLKIPRTRRGKPSGRVPKGVRKVAELWAKGYGPSRRQATLGELARAADMSGPALLEWIGTPGTADKPGTPGKPGFWRVVAEHWAEEIGTEHLTAKPGKPDGKSS
jgi:hypothetical protein